MPIYEYECLTSGHRFEVLQKISDPPVADCQVCGGTVKKLISRSAFLLKGGGWYKDGYSSNGAAKKTEPCASASSCSHSSACSAEKGESSESSKKERKNHDH